MPMPLSQRRHALKASGAQIQTVPCKEQRNERPIPQKGEPDENEKGGAFGGTASTGRSSDGTGSA
jgi:hypothetical protein